MCMDTRRGTRCACFVRWSFPGILQHPSLRHPPQRQLQPPQATKGCPREERVLRRFKRIEEMFNTSTD